MVQEKLLITFYFWNRNTDIKYIYDLHYFV